MTVAAPAVSFDVFLSYSSRDAEAVGRIAEQLARAGIEPWLDRWCLTPGAPWQEELAAGLMASSACAVFVGPGDVGDWSREEVAVALDRAAKQRDFRLFLVLLPGLPEPFEVGTLTPFLSTRTWVDFRRGLDDRRALQALVNAVKGVPLGPETPLIPRDDVCPYRGLQAFDEEHAELFFGRDADVQRLEEKLKAEPFLAVIGPSGSGKSSLARAGLIPALRRGALPGGEGWRLVALRPGAHPLDALTGELLGAYPDLAPAALRDQLADDPRTLRLVAARPPAGGTRVLLLADQCEEVFTLCRSVEERQAFLLNVLHAAAAGGPAVVVLTMRADFYPRLAALPELAQHVAAHQFLVGPLNEDGLRQAIEEPARLAGLELEAGLVDTVLDDVRNQPGALPLLEHALLELWRRRRGGMLTLEAYQESGGVAGALAQRADSILAGFDEHERAIVRRVLLRLTQPGEGAEDTRRRAGMGELLSLPEDAGAIERVVRSLSDARLLITGGSEVEVAHEALIRGWPQLRRWVEEDRQGLRTHRRLTEAAEEWQALVRDPGALYRGTRLAATREWAADHESDLNELEHEFLAASVAAEEATREAERRRTRRLRALVAILGALFVVAAVLAVVALRSSQRATRSEKAAIAGALTGKANRRLDSQLDTAMLLALQAYEKSGTVEARDAALRAVQSADGLAALNSTGFNLTGALAVTRDRRIMAVAGGSQSDNDIGLWSIHPWRKLASLLGHTDDVLTLEFSPDGTMLASGSEDDTVRLWAVPTGRPIGPPLQSGHGTAVAFDQAGDRMAIGRRDGGILVIDPHGRDVVAQGTGGDLGVEPEALAFARDGTTLFSGGQETRIQRWKIRGTRVVSDRTCRTGPATSDAIDFALADRGGLLAWAGYNGSVGLLTARTCHVVVMRRGAHPNGTVAVAFDDTGRRLVSGGFPGAKVWTVPELEPVSRLSTSLVADLAFAGRDRLAAVGDVGGAVRTWTLSGAADLARPLPVREDREGGTQLAIADDGSLLATTGAHGEVTLTDTASRKSIGTLPGAPGPSLLAFARGSRLVTVGNSGALGLWDARELKRLGGPVRTGPGYVSELAVSPDGRDFATSKTAPDSNRAQVQVWSVDTLAPRGRALVVPAGVDALQFTSGDRLLVCVAGGRLEERDTATWKVDGTLGDCHDAPLALSPDGHTLAVGDPGGIALWDMPERRHDGQLVARMYTVASVAFSGDGNMLASLSETEAAPFVTLWDVPRRERIGDTLRGYDQMALGGNVLVTAGRAATDVWNPLILSDDVKPFQRWICGIVQRNLTPAERAELMPAGGYEPTC